MFNSEFCLLAYKVKNILLSVSFRKSLLAFSLKQKLCFPINSTSACKYVHKK